MIQTQLKSAEPIYSQPNGPKKMPFILGSKENKTDTHNFGAACKPQPKWLRISTDPWTSWWGFTSTTFELVPSTLPFCLATPLKTHRLIAIFGATPKIVGSSGLPLKPTERGLPKTRRSRLLALPNLRPGGMYCASLAGTPSCSQQSISSLEFATQNEACQTLRPLGRLGLGLDWWRGDLIWGSKSPYCFGLFGKGFE